MKKLYFLLSVFGTTAGSLDLSSWLIGLGEDFLEVFPFLEAEALAIVSVSKVRFKSKFDPDQWGVK